MKLALILLVVAFGSCCLLLGYNMALKDPVEERAIILARLQQIKNPG